MSSALTRSIAEAGFEVEVAFRCGAASFETGKPSLGELLSAADNALARARNGSASHAVLSMEGLAGRIDSSTDWRTRIAAALNRGAVALYAQPVMSIPDRRTLQLEVTARLVEDTGAPVPAAQFFPMAARHGFASSIDRIVIDAVLANLAGGVLGGSPLAVNVSSQSLRDPGFMGWLAGRLAARPAHAALLTFELSDTAASSSPEDAARFAAAVRAAHARFALDNFGLQEGSLRMLARLLPDYVKLGAGHTESLRQDAPARFFIESVVRIGRSLSIPIIAQAIEDESLLEVLATLGVSGAQGYALGRPAEIGSRDKTP
jgi:EAL domain-containing protein (putative c-di-GMP-specific phosphodiesterase class I)